MRSSQLHAGAALQRAATAAAANMVTAIGSAAVLCCCGARRAPPPLSREYAQNMLAGDLEDQAMMNWDADLPR